MIYLILVLIVSLFFVLLVVDREGLDRVEVVGVVEFG
jgi:hypothetical protein